MNNLFQVNIKFNDKTNISLGYKLCVNAANEYTNNLYFSQKNALHKAKSIFQQSTLNADDKSRFMIFQKMSIYYESALETFIKIGGEKDKQKGLIFFVVIY